MRSATKQTTLVEGSKGDKADARKLAELLRTGMLRSVWHARQTTRGLKELVRAYETFVMDTSRTMLRIKALYRSRGIATKGSGVYQKRERDHWLKQLTEVGIQQPRRGCMNSWIRFGNSGNERRRLCLAKENIIKPSSYYERFLKSVQSVRLRLSLVLGLHIDFEPNVSSGVTAVWPL